MGNTWCNNWYCGGFCNSNSNSADNCEATMGNRQCCSEVFAACAEVKLVGESVPTPSAPSTPSVAPAPRPVAPTPAPTPPATPATTSEPEPEPEPESEPESETGGATCKATPGLNRGVSDSACAQCAAGYKWWPCNEAELCECTGTAVAQLGTKMETKKRSVRRNLMMKQSFLAPNV